MDVIATKFVDAILWVAVIIWAIFVIYVAEIVSYSVTFDFVRLSLAVIRELTTTTGFDKSIPIEVFISGALMSLRKRK